MSKNRKGQKVFTLETSCCQIENHTLNMVCSPKCIYFPNMDCSEWEYDSNIHYIKRRAKEKQWICGYDGHIIKSWCAPCPKIEERKNKRYIYD